MLFYFAKFSLHILVVIAAVFLTTKYGSQWGITKRETRKSEDIKRAVLQKMEKTVAKVCDTNVPKNCFFVSDRAYLDHENLIVERSLKVSDISDVKISAAELETPQELSWKNFNTKKWNINKLVIRNLYAKVMIGVAFMAEALHFDPEQYQDVLVIGLGGGVMSNFLSAVDFIKVNLTTVDIDPTMAQIAKEWFGVVENVCYNDNKPIVCPVPEFTRVEVVKHLSEVLDNEGVLALNILCMRDAIGIEDEMLATYKDHFKTCYLLRYKLSQRLLVCTNRQNWSFEEQRDRFLKNLWNIDDRLLVRREMLISKTMYSFSTAALVVPSGILNKGNRNTSVWEIDKHFLHSPYARVMVGFVFAMEGLKFNPTNKQDVLLLGLGGGVVANFLSSLKTAKLKMTSIELDPTVRDIAVKWFNLEENDMHKVITADGAQFVKDEAKKGRKYKAIFLDACYTTCPAKVFSNPDVVESIASLLDKDGVLAVNVLTAPFKNEEQVNKIMQLYKTQFTSCFTFLVGLQHVRTRSFYPRATMMSINICVTGSTVFSSLCLDSGRADGLFFEKFRRS
ncbi:unnamed protein product [Strongylus vulgaris]|uniref:PABS domain-containing protein n=1 Tax=Strongylus vulgaris TaxID=40348 RepID=A0A3P7LAX1_STRVU|nr:unnamed protein product [Strongylus vulgaris]